MSNALNDQPRARTRFRLSFDGWAVVVALLLAFLVWSGAIHRIPW